MTSASAWAAPLVELLDLAHPPVAITFGTQPVTSRDGSLPAQPAGCCFWEPAQRQSSTRAPRTTPTAAPEAIHMAWSTWPAPRPGPTPPP